LCQEKALNFLEKNLRGEQKFTPEENYYLASAAEILLDMSNKYGQE